MINRTPPPNDGGLGLGQALVAQTAPVESASLAEREKKPMCLGVPGQVVSLDEPGDGLVMGKVSFGGVEREVCFGYASEAKVGDYVLVHVGFAISILDETEAQRILEDFETIARINAEQDAELAARSTGESS